jgi:hypothetical protein
VRYTTGRFAKVTVTSGIKKPVALTGFSYLPGEILAAIQFGRHSVLTIKIPIVSTGQKFPIDRQVRAQSDEQTDQNDPQHDA